MKSRLEFIIDLPAADAMYHHNCYTNFVRGRQPPCQSISESGRYEDSVKLNLFTEMCEWFESCNDQLCSLVELREWMIKKSGNEDMVYTAQSIKRKLIECYGDHLFFWRVAWSERYRSSQGYGIVYYKCKMVCRAKRKCRRGE